MIKQMKKKVKNTKDAILLRTEMAAYMTIKNAWEKEYKEALKHEDERITRVIAKKETRQKELLNKKTELRAMREGTIDKIAKKLLDNVHKEKEREKIRNELYQEEQMLKWVKEPTKLASRKQYAIVESLKEMMRRQKAIAECKAKDDAINAIFLQYLAKECEKDIEK